MKREKKVVAIVKFWPQWLVLEDVKITTQTKTKQKHRNKKENINAPLSFPGFC